MRVIATIARLLLGAVFIFSGFVKGVDPLGSTYKFIDYFTAFNMMWLSPLAFTLAIAQNTLETLIGVALVLRLRMNIAAWAVSVFMLFYTPLTLVLALTNPVTDCGCFGDALILTNWETFFKNIVLLALAAIVFVYRKRYRPLYSPMTEWLWTAAFAVAVTFIGIYGYRHLPLLDFRPYHVGADIPQGMTVPDGAPVDEYASTLIYESNGVQKEFSEDEYNKVWDDSIWNANWTFVDRKDKLIKAGYKPPIHDFTLTTAADGVDITDEVLADPAYTFLFVAYRLDEANDDALVSANAISQFCRDNGFRFYCMTSSLNDDIEATKARLDLNYDFCLTDGITLKTIIRANPGLVLLQRGTVIGKWHYRDMPAASDLKPNLLSFALQQQAATSEHRITWFLLALFLLAAMTLYWQKTHNSRKGIA